MTIFNDVKIGTKVTVKGVGTDFESEVVKETARLWIIENGMSFKKKDLMGKNNPNWIARYTN